MLCWAGIDHLAEIDPKAFWSEVPLAILKGMCYPFQAVPEMLVRVPEYWEGACPFMLGPDMLLPIIKRSVVKFSIVKALLALSPKGSERL